MPASSPKGAVVRVTKWMLQTMLPSANHALDVKGRKDGQIHPNRLAFARMKLASKMHRLFRDNRGKIMNFFDAGTDSRGKGIFKATLTNLCGKNSLMKAMILGGKFTEAERDIQQFPLQ